MLQYDRIDVSQGIDINQTTESKECMLCHYCYFKDVDYKFQLYICNCCHAVSMMAYEFNGVIKTNFLGDEIPKENVHYTCIACISIDSVIRMVKMNYPQVYLEEWKHKIKKIKMTKFIITELESDSESELGSDTELEAKLESDSDSE